jgi:hypothetical protein
LNAAVESVLNLSRKFRLGIDEEAAELFVANRATLAKNPTDAEALRIEAHFTAYFVWAHEPLTLEDFLKPQCKHDCPECRAQNDRSRDRTLAQYAAFDAAYPKDVREKISASGAMRDAPSVGGSPRKEGCIVFLERTKLSIEQVRAMTTEELKRYA